MVFLNRSSLYGICFPLQQATNTPQDSTWQVSVTCGLARCEMDRGFPEQTADRPSYGAAISVQRTSLVWRLCRHYWSRQAQEQYASKGKCAPQISHDSQIPQLQTSRSRSNFITRVRHHRRSNHLHGFQWQVVPRWDCRCGFAGGRTLCDVLLWPAVQDQSLSPPCHWIIGLGLIVHDILPSVVAHAGSFSSALLL